MDEIVDLADRIAAKQRRGEEWEFEFEIEFTALTEDERDQFLALTEQRTAHKQERLETLAEKVRVPVCSSPIRRELSPRCSSLSGSAARCPIRRRIRRPSRDTQRAMSRENVEIVRRRGRRKARSRPCQAPTGLVQWQRRRIRQRLPLRCD